MTSQENTESELHFDELGLRSRETEKRLAGTHLPSRSFQPLLLR
jgi:hypothetical protein